MTLRQHYLLLAIICFLIAAVTLYRVADACAETKPNSPEVEKMVREAFNREWKRHYAL